MESFPHDNVSNSTAKSHANLLYTNPIIPGFAPDPSVVLVDGIYFLVTSSFHLFPGIPIYASYDLQSWTHIGGWLQLNKQPDAHEMRQEMRSTDVRKST